MMKRIFILLGVLLFMGSSIYGQQIRVSGTVTDARDGATLPGVSIVIEGTTTGTVTDINGNYEISAPADATLVFSFIGMETREVPIQGRSTINVELESEMVGLEEVLVIAYGTTRRESFTGVADVISSDKLERRQVSNVSRALEGTGPGIQVTSGGGQPGASAQIRLRGFGSINASNAPLYVVDGVPYDGALNAINPDDIESITVLRDASAAALYGARGANGVIMITTRSGDVQRPSMRFSSRVGVVDRTIPEYPRVNSGEFMLLSWEAYRNNLHFNQGLDLEDANMVATWGAEAGLGYQNDIVNLLGDYNPFAVPEGEPLFVWDADNPWIGSLNPNASLLYEDDWQDDLFSTAIRQEHTFRVSGGTETSDYYLSLGYLDEEGLALNSQFERFSARLNMNTQPKDWFETGLNLSGSVSETFAQPFTGTQTSNAFFFSRTIGPIYPVYLRGGDGEFILDEDGNKQFDFGTGDGPQDTRPYAAMSNPVGSLVLDDRSNTRENVAARTFAQFNILDGLNFRVNLAVDYYSQYATTFQNPEIGDAADISGRGTKAHTRNISYTFNQLLNYGRSFGDHNIDFLAGHEAYQRRLNFASATRIGFPIPGITEIGIATSMEASTSFTHSYNVEGYFSRLSYDYLNRYYISGSYRRDGSSRFHEDVRWGNFYSLGLSWRVTQEDFMQGLDWLDNLRLKASYGEQGNDGLLLPGGGSMWYAWQSFFDLGFDNNTQPGAVYSQHENRNLQWEINRNTNIGFDARFFDRFELEFDYFIRASSNLLFQVPLPLSTGVNQIAMNVGEMQNTGIEFRFLANVVHTRDFRWDVDFNITRLQNEVTKLPGDPFMVGTRRIEEGRSMFEHYLREVAGINEWGETLYFMDELDEDGEPTGERITTTDANDADRYYIGSQGIPDFWGGLTNNFTVGNFDLSVLVTYGVGGEMYDLNYSWLSGEGRYGYHLHEDRLNRWRQPGDAEVTSEPRMENDNIFLFAASDHNLKPMDYIAIKNITLNYRVPQRLIGQYGIADLGLFVSGDNLFVFNENTGMDPQHSFTGQTDHGYIPVRTITFGVNLQF